MHGIGNITILKAMAYPNMSYHFAKIIIKLKKPSTKNLAFFCVFERNLMKIFGIIILV